MVAFAAPLSVLHATSAMRAANNGEYRKAAELFAKAADAVRIGNAQLKREYAEMAVACMEMHLGHHPV